MSIHQATASVNWANRSTLAAIREQLRELDAPPPAAAPFPDQQQPFVQRDSLFDLSLNDPVLAVMPPAPFPVQQQQPQQARSVQAQALAQALSAPSAAAGALLPPPPRSAKTRLAGNAASGGPAVRLGSQRAFATLPARAFGSAQDLTPPVVVAPPPPTSPEASSLPLVAPAPSLPVPALDALKLTLPNSTHVRTPSKDEKIARELGNLRQSNTPRRRATQAYLEMAYGDAAKKEAQQVVVQQLQKLQLQQSQAIQQQQQQQQLQAPPSHLQVTESAAALQPTRDERLECPTCGFAFPSELALRAHIGTQHPAVAAAAAATASAAASTVAQQQQQQRAHVPPSYVSGSVTVSRGKNPFRMFAQSSTPPPPSTADIFATSSMVFAPASLPVVPPPAAPMLLNRSMEETSSSSRAYALQATPVAQQAQQQKQQPAKEQEQLQQVLFHPHNPMRRSASYGNILEDLGIAAVAAAAPAPSGISSALSSAQVQPAPVEDQRACKRHSHKKEEKKSDKKEEPRKGTITVTAAASAPVAVPSPTSRARGYSFGRSASSGTKSPSSAEDNSKPRKSAGAKGSFSPPGPAPGPLLVDLTFVPVAAPTTATLVAPKQALLRPRRARTQEELVVIVQAVARGWQERRWFKPEYHRSKVAHEIESSEATFVHSLRELLDVFVTPLRRALEKGKPLISAEDIMALFEQIERIHEFNAAFHAALKKRVSHWTIGSTIGEVFRKLDKQGMLRLYCEFTVSYNGILERFLKLRRANHAFDRFADTCEKRFWCNAKNGNSFQSFLILPIQRLPRYMLLLKEMLRWTDEAHPDYADISAACAVFDEMLWQVNEHKRKEDLEARRVECLVALGSKVEPKLLDLTMSADRYVVDGVEGPVSMFKPDKDGARERYYFLLSDLLIVTSPAKRGRYGLKHVINLAMVRFRDIPGTTTFLKREVSHVIEVHTAEQMYVMMFPSADAKSRALEAISKMQVQLQQAMQSSSGQPSPTRPTTPPQPRRRF